MHLHLDPVGGLAGDMFIASVLDAFPELEEGVVQAASGASGVRCEKIAYSDEVLAGSRFSVQQDESAARIAHEHTGKHHSHSHWHHPHDDLDRDHHPPVHRDAHATFAAIRERLDRAPLTRGVRDHAIGIFGLLADAEARVHAVNVDDVTFHEVGAADSIADIVGAAYLIDALDGSWSVSRLPLGGGQVRTAHGMLPVPAPATALLLEGFELWDDGVSGERVTPTGAAIVRYLGCKPRFGVAGRLGRTGIGFGTRTLPGISNILRILALDTEARRVHEHRELVVISFEVDDQSPEDLALGLDRVRGMPGVHDVLQMPAFAKKGRLATHVQVLARPDLRESVVEACFNETTTIGLRMHVVEGRALAREFVDVPVDGTEIRVKRVRRPDGHTSKAESDALKPHAGQAVRARLRRAAEAAADGGS